MATEKLCMGCMQPLPEKATACPQCGYPAAGVNPSEYLPLNTLLNNRYVVGRVLEIGGDSAVYIGVDKNDDSRVTVREFFPPELARRAEDGVSVIAAAGGEDALAACHSRFLQLARAVARLRDVLVVVPSYDIFEENGTAYSVSEYCEGQSLEKYVEAHGGRLPAEDMRRMFLPLISAISTIHATGVLHLALSPKNILVDSEGRLRLKNFAISEVRTESGVCKPSRVAGCAAPEQYVKDATCTAAADVYGLAASMYYALTGRLPAAASARQKKGDELLMPADVADSMPAYIKESLHRALRLSADYRTQTVQQLFDELSATQAVASLRETEEVPMQQKKKTSYLWLVFVVVMVALAILAVFALNGLGYINFGATEATTTTTQGELTMAPTTTTKPIEGVETGSALFEVDKLVGNPWESVQSMTLRGSMKAVVKGYEYSSAAKGTVLSQSPEAGERVERGTTVYVIISAGPSQMAMPDVSGWQEEHARLYLEALGFQVGDSLLQNVSTLEKGTVEKSTPAAGTNVKVGDKVQLYVSNVEQNPAPVTPTEGTATETTVGGTAE